MSHSAFRSDRPFSGACVRLPRRLDLRSHLKAALSAAQAEQAALTPPQGAVFSLRKDGADAGAGLRAGRTGKRMKRAFGDGFLAGLGALTLLYSELDAEPGAESEE